MAAAAKGFLDNLTDEQKAKAVYKLTDAEREHWIYVPQPFEGEGMRKGLTIKDMRPDQRHLAYALLSTGLSYHGYRTALQIMSLEQVLWELENNAPKRDTQMYYITIFGDPGSKAWGWRFEGHHLSMNFTVADGKVISATPSFFASNPGEVRQGPRAGLRVLAAEEDVQRIRVFDKQGRINIDEPLRQYADLALSNAVMVSGAGTFDRLEPMCTALLESGLSADIE